jgi:hypothetical protein
MLDNDATSENQKKTCHTARLPHCGLAIYIKKYLKAKEEL